MRSFVGSRPPISLDPLWRGSSAKNATVRKRGDQMRERHDLRRSVLKACSRSQSRGSDLVGCYASRRVIRRRRSGRPKPVRPSVVAVRRRSRASRPETEDPRSPCSRTRGSLGLGVDPSCGRRRSDLWLVDRLRLLSIISSYIFVDYCVSRWRRCQHW